MAMTPRFGRILRKYRINREIRLQQLADILEISVPYLSSVELSKKAPFADDKIEKAGALLGIGPEGVSTLKQLAALERALIHFQTDIPEMNDTMNALARKISDGQMTTEVWGRVLKVLTGE